MPVEITLRDDTRTTIKVRQHEWHIDERSKMAARIPPRRPAK